MVSLIVANLRKYTPEVMPPWFSLIMANLCKYTPEVMPPLKRGSNFEIINTTVKLS